MPKKFFNKKNGKTKRKRVYPRRKIARVPDTPFPRVRRAKLTYVDEFSLNAAGSVPVYHVFSANGLFDPNITSSGHQPLGFDQYMLLYNHYEVYGSKITVKFIPVSGTDQSYVGVYRDDDASGPTLLTTLLEQPATHARILVADATRPVTVISSYSQKKTFGSKVRGTDGQKGNITTNPAEQQYYMCYQAGIASADPVLVNCIVHIEYYVMFSEFKTLAGS